MSRPRSDGGSVRPTGFVGGVVAWVVACALGCGRIGYELQDDIDPSATPGSVPTRAHPTGAVPDSGPGIVGPPSGGSWQIQLTGSIDTSLDVPFYVLDADVTSRVMTTLHVANRFVACYFSGGTWESFRDDASAFPPASLGNAVAGYPDERWIDVRRADVRAIMEARITSAVQRGCDAILASGLSAYTEDTGFPLTREDQLDYDRWLAATTHAWGRAVGLEDGDVSLARDLVAHFDWAIVWECLDASCNRAAPFTAAGKRGFLASIGTGTGAPGVCAAGATLGLTTIIKRSSLDAFRVACP